MSDLFTAPKVLFLDDDPLVRVLLQTAVPARDFEVLTAASGPAGIALARREIPDAIVVDVLMPHMSGFAVCRQLRADPAFRTIPIVLMSAREDPALAEKGRAVGATCTVGSPAAWRKWPKSSGRPLPTPARGCGAGEYPRPAIAKR